MAWIHPEINGDYRIIGTSITQRGEQDFVIGPYNTFISAEAASVPDLNILGLTWKCVGSTQATSALSNIGVTTSSIYNTNQDLIATNTADLWDGSISNPIGYNLSGTAYSGSVSSGSTGSGGSHPVVPFGDPGGEGVVIGADSTSTTSTWISDSNLGDGSPVPQFFYGISGEVSTISGVLSGTLTRANTGVWAVGVITLTSDTDFGGNVDILESLDISQTPPIPTFGLFKFNVGPGGTAPLSWPDLTERLTTINAGTNNTIEGEIGAGVVTGGVVYE